jgi:ADP-ribosylglycohydrolase
MPPLRARTPNALLGLFLGDALAMPAHWYYDRRALRSDYGTIRDLVEPLPMHPDSILWRSSYRAPNAKGEILHDQARYWGQRGVHYHQFLRAGENTLNLQLAALAVDLIRERGRYDANEYRDRYIAFMTTPGRHRDTYVEECHRHFFGKYALGVDPDACAAIEKHIGGLAGPIAVALALADDRGEAGKAAQAHMGLTHRGPKMEQALDLVLGILFDVLDGKALDSAIFACCDSGALPSALKTWLSLPDEGVVGGLLSPACYVDDAVPATLYFASKYASDPEAGLIANANVGGDNCHRGAVLGALLGAAHTTGVWPQRWLDALRQPVPAS